MMRSSVIILLSFLVFSAYSDVSISAGSVENAPPVVLDLSGINWPSLDYTTKPIIVEDKVSSSTLHILKDLKTPKVRITLVFSPSLFSFKKEEIPTLLVFSELLIKGGFGNLTYGRYLKEYAKENGIMELAASYEMGKLVVRVGCLKDDIRAAVELLKMVIIQYRLEQDEFKVWKSQAQNAFSEFLQALDMQSQNRTAIQQIHQTIYGADSYISNMFKAQVPKYFDPMTREDMVRAAEQLITRRDINVFLTGYVTRDLEKLVSNLVALIPDKEFGEMEWLPEKPILPAVFGKYRVQIISKPDMTQANVYVVNVYPHLGELNDIELVRLGILDNIFSGSSVRALGMDRISKALRTDSGLSYAPMGGINPKTRTPNKNVVSSIIHFQTSNERLFEGVQVALKTWDEFVNSGATGNEYERSRISMINSTLAQENTIFSYESDILTDVIRGEQPSRIGVQRSIRFLQQQTSVEEANRLFMKFKVDPVIPLIVIMGNPDGDAIARIQSRFGQDNVSVTPYREVALQYSDNK